MLPSSFLSCISYSPACCPCIREEQIQGQNVEKQFDFVDTLSGSIPRTSVDVGKSEAMLYGWITRFNISASVQHDMTSGRPRISYGNS